MLLVMNHLTVLLNLPFTTIQQLVSKEPLILAQDLPLLSASYQSLQLLWSNIGQSPGQSLLNQLLQQEPALLLLAPGRLQQVLQQQAAGLGLNPGAWVAAVGRSPELLRMVQGEVQGLAGKSQEQGQGLGNGQAGAEGTVPGHSEKERAGEDGFRQRFRALLLGGPWSPQKMLEVVEVEPRLLRMSEEVRSGKFMGTLL